MYQEPGLTWLEPQAEVVEELVTSTEANNGESPRIMTAWVGRLGSTSPVSSIRGQRAVEEPAGFANVQ
jgi:hypothetical protein